MYPEIDGIIAVDLCEVSGVDKIRWLIQHGLTTYLIDTKPTRL